MSATTQTKEEPAKKEVVKDFEDRIDEDAISRFQAMGFTGRLADGHIAIYKTFKHHKDMLKPGPLSPEGFAFVATLADMSSGKLNLR